MRLSCCPRPDDAPYAWSWLEWNEPCDAPEPMRRCPGRGPSSWSIVGCQSIGCMRSSNSADGLNFHLRIMVQMMTAPPMQDATTMMTVTVVFAMDEEPEAVAAGVSVGASEAEVLVSVSVTSAGPVGPCAALVVADVLEAGWLVVGGREREVVDEVEVDDDDVVEVDVVDVDVAEVEVLVEVLLVVDVDYKTIGKKRSTKSPTTKRGT